MEVVLVPRFPVCKRTLPPRRHTGAGGLARYAPLPPLCTRCCDGLLLLATKSRSERGTPSLLRNLEHGIGTATPSLSTNIRAETRSKRTISMISNNRISSPHQT